MPITKNTLQKIDNIDLLKAFAIIIIVLRHSFAPYTGSWRFEVHYQHDEAANVIGKYISTISMPLFVFISGFIYSYLRNYLNKYDSFSNLLKKKTRRLLIPYLIIAPLYLFTFLEVTSVMDFFKQMFSGIGHLWFLLMIYILFLLFYNIEEFLKIYIVKGIFLVLFLFSIAPLASYLGLGIIATVFKYLPFFYLGYLFYYKNHEIIGFIKNKFWLTFILHLLLFTITIKLTPYIDNKFIALFISHFPIIPLGILSITYIYILFYNFDQKLSNPIKNTTKLINKNSYYIYIIHQPLLMIMYGTDLLFPLYAWYVIPIVFTICFLFSLLISEKILMKYKLSRLLINA